MNSLRFLPLSVLVLTPMAAQTAAPLLLPFNGTPVARDGALFSIHNIGTKDAWAIYGRSDTSIGLFGQTMANAQSGVLGRNDGPTGAEGAGVFGYAATGANGVMAISEQGNGLWAVTNGANKNSIFAQTSQKTSVAGRFLNLAVRGRADDIFPTALFAETVGGWSVYARTQSGIGVFGQTMLGGTGVFGRNEGDIGAAVHGLSEKGALGVRGDSRDNDGIWGQTGGKGKSGVVGVADNEVSNGVAGLNDSGTGVFGLTRNAKAAAAVFQNLGGGDAVRAQGNVQVFGTTTTRVLTITGGADLAEPFAVAGDPPAGSVLVIDAERPGQLCTSIQSYDTKVAGVISGANGVSPGITLQQEGVLDGGRQVALSGRVYVLADASHGAIEPGDLLTTSETAGHAMKASDPARAPGSILGKAMTSLPNGRGYVLVLVSLQ